ncbi:NUDIX domain-containing protein [Rossellomorea vietnamensis]|uniref:NUDIX domain-containing protein n=1 Tax=Rossellomorea vietnamensis TaxID=218284 RepID=A0A5D4MI90_9BACI|nr:NUDIX domain-containing protein [Rossellomorea vietnamensis]TYS01550.1 NUDIX domain-containing protein [Rossellomorea vietnamensis]
MNHPIRVKAGALIIQDQKVLLAKFKDENGIHYNLPGGGVEKGESTSEAAVREAKEEAGVDVIVANLAFIYEYAPHQNDYIFGNTPNLSLFFDCRISGMDSPLPDSPDLNQVGAEWILIVKLETITLYPKIQPQIKAYAAGLYSADLIEESRLGK